MVLRYAIDRFEEQKAVLQDDDGNAILADRARLPSEAVPGDVLSFCDGVYHLDCEETAKRRNRIHRLEQLLRDKGKDA